MFQTNHYGGTPGRGLKFCAMLIEFASNQDDLQILNANLLQRFDDAAGRVQRITTAGGDENPGGYGGNVPRPVPPYSELPPQENEFGAQQQPGAGLAISIQ